MIPDGHKFALLALRADAQLGAHFVQIGEGLHAMHEPPVNIPEHWKEWLGTIEVRRLKECRLFLLANAPSETPDVLDDESVWLEHRLNLFHSALALASVGYHVSHGQLLIGARTKEHTSVRQVRRVEPIIHSPGLPLEFIVTLQQLRHADRLVPILWELGLNGTHGRLWRALRAFESALHTVDLSNRLHQLVRAVEGIMPIPAGKKERGDRSQRDWFADKSSILWTEPANRDRLLAMYDARGATEHLAVPVRDLQKRDPSLSAAEAEIPFAALVFLAEGLARHALVRVLESGTLLPHFATERSMTSFWAQPDAEIRKAWGGPFPATEYERRFDADRARDQLERGRQDRHHRRVMLARAPSSYRGAP